MLHSEAATAAVGVPGRKLNTCRLRLESSPRISTVPLMSAQILQALPGDLLWESATQRQISLFFLFFNFEEWPKVWIREDVWSLLCSAPQQAQATVQRSSAWSSDITAVCRAQTTQRRGKQHIAPAEVPKHSSVPPEEHETHLKRLCSALPSIPSSGHILQRTCGHFRMHDAGMPLGG